MRPTVLDILAAPLRVADGPSMLDVARVLIGYPDPAHRTIIERALILTATRAVALAADREGAVEYTVRDAAEIERDVRAHTPLIPRRAWASIGRYALTHTPAEVLSLVRTAHQQLGSMVVPPRTVEAEAFVAGIIRDMTPRAQRGAVRGHTPEALAALKRLEVAIHGAARLAATRGPLPPSVIATFLRDAADIYEARDRQAPRAGTALVTVYDQPAGSA